MRHPGVGERAIRLRLAFGLASLLVATASIAYDPRPHRVNSTDDPFIPYVQEARIAPNGEWIVWRQAGSSPSLKRLYSARRWAGSAPIPLTPQVADSAYSLRFWISRDSRFVLFVSKGVKDGKHEAWSIPIDGGSEAVRLNPSVSWDPHVEAVLVGDRAILTGHFNAEFTREVWSAPVDGSVPAIQLNPEMAAGAPSIRSLIWPRTETLVAFVADVENDGHSDLWLRPVDGSGPARRLNELPGAPPGVIEFSPQFSLDGSWILYLESGPNSQGEVWSAPMTPPGNARRISPAGHWREAKWNSRLSRALLVSDADDDSRDEIWSVPLGGPASAATQLAESSVDFGFIDSYTFFLDAKEEHAIFRGRLDDPDHQEVWRAPVDGSAPVSRVNPPVQHAFPAYSFLLPPLDGETTTIFQGNYLERDDVGNWRAAIDGTEPNVRLDAPPAQGATWSTFARSPTHFVYADFEPPSSSSLWSVMPAAPGVPIRLSEPHPDPWSVSSIRLAPGFQRVVYLGEPGTPVGRELFAVPAQGPFEASIRLNPELPEGGLVSEILTISPDGEGVLFLAEIDGQFGLELWISDGMIFMSDFEESNTSEWSSSGDGS